MKNLIKRIGMATKKILEIDPDFLRKQILKILKDLKDVWRFLKEQEINYHHTIKKEKKERFSNY